MKHYRGEIWINTVGRVLFVHYIVLNTLKKGVCMCGWQVCTAQKQGVEQHVQCVNFTCHTHPMPSGSISLGHIG